MVEFLLCFLLTVVTLMYIKLCEIKNELGKETVIKAIENSLVH